MSHLTYMKTRFQNLSYLEKALTKLNIAFNQQKSHPELSQHNLAIPQANGHEIEFCWNGKEYELVVD